MCLFEHGSVPQVGGPRDIAVRIVRMRRAFRWPTLVLAPAAAQHPFPVAISEGLAPEAEVPQAPAGEVHTQVSRNDDL